VSKQSDAVKKWRSSTKSRIVESMGGCCQICSYDKCNNALELHHIDPEEKELSFGNVMANPKSWDNIVKELRKCILLCSNCHKEVHSGITELPETHNTFDEDFVIYIQTEVTYCPVCGKEKPKTYTTCSKKCAGSLRGKVDWSKFDLVEMKKTLTNSRIAEIIGVSETMIRKKLKIT